jgi:hypothetical protein
MIFNPTIVMTWIVGLAWVFLIIEWLDAIRQFIAVRPYADPDSIDLSSRETARAQAESLAGRSMIARRLRSLLSAWAHGAEPRELIAISATQSTRFNRRLGAVGIFMALVFVAGLKLSVVVNPSWLGLALVGATVFAKGLVLGRIDSVIESSFLIRVPSNLPGTGITAGDLGKELGASIEQAFKNYVPQPDKLAGVVGEAVERGRKAAAEAEKAAVAALESARKAIEGLSGQLTSSLTAHTDKVQSVLGQHNEQWVKASQASSAQLGSVLGASNDKLQGLLAQHAEQFGKASQSLSAQLDRIMALEKDIDKVLHVQQTVEGAIRSVTAADEFRQMLSALRGHLQESDKLLREVARPRTIRLVESES